MLQRSSHQRVLRLLRTDQSPRWSTHLAVAYSSVEFCPLISLAPWLQPGDRALRGKEKPFKRFPITFATKNHRAKASVLMKAFSNLFENARQSLWFVEHSDRRNALRTSAQAVGKILFRNSADRQNRKRLQL